MRDEDQKSLYLDWIKQHSASIVKIARAYTRTTDERQDLVQEILLQAWRSLSKFEGRSSVSTWFYRVALNTAMTWHRRETPRRTHETSLLEIQPTACDEMDGPERAQNRETVEQLNRAIQQLPKSDAALVLLYLEELSYSEMSEVLGISVSNVGVKLNRAKKALSEIMNGQTDG